MSHRARTYEHDIPACWLDEPLHRPPSHGQLSSAQGMTRQQCEVLLCECHAHLTEKRAPARGLWMLGVLTDANESIRSLRAQVIAQTDVVEVRRHDDKLACSLTRCIGLQQSAGKVGGLQLCNI